jgi:hypothetical protein
MMGLQIADHLADTSSSFIAAIFRRRPSGPVRCCPIAGHFRFHTAQYGVWKPHQ